MHAAYDFSWSPYMSSRRWYFEDLFERDFQKYTHHFLWCCYALAWGVQQHDDLKETVPA